MRRHDSRYGGPSPGSGGGTATRSPIYTPTRGEITRYSQSELNRIEARAADLKRQYPRRSVERYAYSTPGNTNVFVPSHAATGGLMTGFSRNPKDFPINKYIQIFEVEKTLGYYATWLSRQAARIHHNDLRDWAWKDGNDAPTGVDNLETFSYIPYETFRYCFPFTLGEMTIQLADWNVLQAHSEMVAQQCMTGITAWAYNLWGTASQWGTHCANVNGSSGNLNGNAPILGNGQDWTNGTGTKPNIRITLNRVRAKINQDTIGVVGPKDLIIVMNPNTAMQAAESPEITQYLANSQFAMGSLEGDLAGMNEYGFPSMYNGSRVVIEDAVIDTALKGQTDTISYVVPDGVVGVFVRKGSLEGIGGGPAYSTLIKFWYQDDMTVESLYDPNNKLTRGRVVTNFTVVISNSNAGFLLNACTPTLTLP